MSHSPITIVETKDISEAVAKSIQAFGLDETAIAIGYELIHLCGLLGHDFEFESKKGTVKANITNNDG